MKKRKILPLIGLCILMGLDSIAQDLEIEWLKHISGPSLLFGQAIAVDDEESSYVIGNFWDTLNITTASGVAHFVPVRRSDPLYAYNYDLFIVKIDIEGTILWAKHIGGAGSVEGQDVVVDKAKNVYITGFYSDEVDFDPGVDEVFLNTTHYQIPGSGSGGGGDDDGGDEDAGREGYYANSFLLKLNHEGDFQWVRALSGKPNSSYGVSIEHDGKHIYIAGKFQDTIDVNQGSGTDLLTTTFTGASPEEVLDNVPPEAFVVKFDSLGTYVWARKMGSGSQTYGTGGNEAFAIHVDHNNNVYTTGMFADSSDFDPGPGVDYLISRSKPGRNVFISKLDAGGNHVWAKGVGGTTTGRGSRGSAITTDISGNVLITGYFQISADFDPLQAGASSILVGNGNISNFIAKYDSAGAFIWTGSLTGNNGVEQGLGIATDEVGSIYTSGLFTLDVDFNPQHNPPYILNATPFNNQNSFVSKLDKDGNFLWARHFSGGFNTGYDLAVSTLRNVFVTGNLMQTVDFNPSGTPMPLTSVVSGDAYVLKLSCPESSATQVNAESCADSYEMNGRIYHTSGIYKQIFRNVADCDSVVTLDLTLNSITKPVINVEEFVLGVAASYNSYQWIFNGKEIAGATDSTLTVNENGEYQVAVTSDEGCKDTSDVYTVDNVGINDQMSLASKVSIYPNPTAGIIHLAAATDVNAQITSVEGKELLYIRNAKELSLENLSPGVYFIRLFDKNDNLIKVEKVVKQ